MTFDAATLYKKILEKEGVNFGDLHEHLVKKEKSTQLRKMKTLSKRKTGGNLLGSSDGVSGMKDNVSSFGSMTGHKIPQMQSQLVSGAGGSFGQRGNTGKNPSTY